MILLCLLLVGLRRLFGSASLFFLAALAVFTALLGTLTDAGLNGRLQPVQVRHKRRNGVALRLTDREQHRHNVQTQGGNQQNPSQPQDPGG